LLSAASLISITRAEVRSRVMERPRGGTRRQPINKGMPAPRAPFGIAYSKGLLGAKQDHGVATR
jgi:hypothetical protein